jgi:hypothetical protein
MAAAKHAMRLKAGILLAAAVLLGWQFQPQLCFVDIISVLERASRIPSGEDLLHPLYPVGYPALLSILPGSMQLDWAKLISMLGAMIMLLAVLRRMPWSASLGLLCTGVWAQWGSTEGTDMLAASLSIMAILFSREKTVLSAMLLGLAFLTRYTAIVALPFVLWNMPNRRNGVLCLALVTAPHWALALWQGEPFFNQSENLLRGGESSFLGRCGQTGLWLLNPVSMLGSVGLWRMRREWLPRSLLLFALLHCLVITMVFPNQRLVLPALLGISLGCAHLSSRWLWLVLAGGLWLNAGIERDGEWETLAELSHHESLKEGGFLASSAKVHSWRSDGIQSAVPLQALAEAHLIDPKMAAGWAKQNDVAHLVLRERDCGRRFPALIHLFREPRPPGFSKGDCVGDWCIFRIADP